MRATIFSFDSECICSPERPNNNKPMNLLKLYAMRNELIKRRAWDRLPLTTNSNFTLLNFNECWLRPPPPPPLTRLVSVMCLCCPLFLQTVSRPQPLWSFTSLPSSSFRRTVSFSPSLCAFSLFFITMVFRSIYSEATRLLKAERLPWASLFAWDFLPFTIFKCNYFHSHTNRTAAALSRFKRHSNFLFTSSLLVYLQVVYIASNHFMCPSQVGFIILIDNNLWQEYV